MLTYQGCFFSKVRTMAGNYNLPGDMTLAAFASQTINPAMTRTEVAFLQY